MSLYVGNTEIKGVATGDAATMSTSIVDGKIGEHNADIEAHIDIRAAIEAVSDSTKPFLVTIANDGDYNYTCDKTFAEIKAAYDGGYSIKGIGAYMGEVSGTIYTLSKIGDGYATFVGFLSSSQYQITIDEYGLVERQDLYTVNIEGDTMRGFLSLYDDPINDLHAATKRYVDTTINAAISAAIGGSY